MVLLNIFITVNTMLVYLGNHTSNLTPPLDDEGGFQSQYSLEKIWKIHPTGFITY